MTSAAAHPRPGHPSIEEQRAVVVAALEAELDGPGYAGGDYFASTSDVRRRFQVSQGTAAAALARLVNARRLVVRRGRGHYVI